MVYAMFQCLIFNFISFNFLTLINHFIKVKNISVPGGHFRPMMLTQRAVWSLYKRCKHEPITWALGVSEYEVLTLYLWPFWHFPVSLRGVYRHLVSLSTCPPRVEAMKEIITKEIGHFQTSCLRSKWPSIPYKSNNCVRCVVPLPEIGNAILFAFWCTTQGKCLRKSFHFPLAFKKLTVKFHLVSWAYKWNEHTNGLVILM